jgi:hypothetical protein
LPVKPASPKGNPLQKRSKRLLAAALAVAGVVVASGVAYAAFFYQQQATASGSAATFGNITVDAQWDSSLPLLPGGANDVKLLITSPNGNNVNARVTSISAVNIAANEITGPATDADKADCATWLVERTIGDTTGIVLPPNSTVALVINDGVALHGDATVKCQGMTFPSKWNVRLDATNDAATMSSGQTLTF